VIESEKARDYALSARWVVLLVIGSSVLTLGIVLGLKWREDTNRFNIAKWHAAKPGFCNDAFRRDMVDDLVSGGYLTVGMPRSEVIWLLGLPDYTTTERPTTVPAGTRGCSTTRPALSSSWSWGLRVGRLFTGVRPRH